MPRTSPFAIGLALGLVIAGCGEEESSSEAPGGKSDSPGPKAGAAKESGNAGRLGRTILLNPTPRRQEANGFVLDPYAVRELSDEEARQTEWTAEAGHERIVTIGGTADFELTRITYAFGEAALHGPGPARIQKWEDAADISVVCDHGILEDAPGSVSAPIGSGAIVRTDLDWSAREVPPEAEWTDDLRVAVLGGDLNAMPGVLVGRAQAGLDGSADTRLVPILLRLVTGIRRHGAYHRSLPDDNLVLFRLLAAEDAIDVEAVEAQIAGAKRDARSARGTIAAAWVHLGEPDRGLRLLPADPKDAPAFFLGMAGAPPEAIWALAGPAWDSMDGNGHEAAGKALVFAGQPLAVEATKTVSAASRGPGMIQLSADLLEPWEELIQRAGTALGAERLVPMLEALLGHPNQDFATRAIDRLLGEPAAGWPVVLAAWTSIRGEATRARVLAAVLEREGAPAEAKLPFALAALDGEKRELEPAHAWIVANSIDLSAADRTRLLAALERAKVKPEILWAGGPSWWGVLGERWALLSEHDRSAALRAVLARSDVSLDQKRPVLETALADPVYRVVDQALEWARTQSSLPSALWQRTLQAALDRGVGGHEYLRKLPPDAWPEALSMWQGLEAREREVLISAAVLRTDLPDSSRNAILDKGLEEEGHAQWDVLKWICEHPGETKGSIKKKAREVARGAKVPQWLAAQVRDKLGD